VRQQWLEPVRTGGGAAYAMTPRAWRRLDQAADRIYRTRDAGWAGTWHLVVVDPISERGARDRVRSALAFLGYAPLAENTWLAAYASDEVEAVVTGEGGRTRTFRASPEGDPRRLARELWDLDALGAAYGRWLAQARGMTAGVSDATDDQTAFAVRSRLVHEWRKFLFSDPGLPRQLLPARWPGEEAAAFFDAEAARLLPAASRFVDSCLQLSTATNGAVL
jgi:phenylacetic acid degradation operon negative regulatory protein